MSDTITLAKVEEFFSCEDSDEALERAAGKENAAGYTLLYCTSSCCWSLKNRQAARLA
jgi:hypothetical protein